MHLTNTSTLYLQILPPCSISLQFLAEHNLYCKRCLTEWLISTHHWALSLCGDNDREIPIVATLIKNWTSFWPTVNGKSPSSLQSRDDAHAHPIVHVISALIRKFEGVHYTTLNYRITVQDQKFTKNLHILLPTINFDLFSSHFWTRILYFVI